MTLLDQINELILRFKNINSSTDAITTLVTLVGALVVLVCIVKVLFAAQQGKYGGKQISCTISNYHFSSNHRHERIDELIE